MAAKRTNLPGTPSSPQRSSDDSIISDILSQPSQPPAKVSHVECITGCQVSNNSNPIECKLCGINYHRKCAGVTKGLQVWFCIKCKRIPYCISDLQETVQSLTTKVNQQASRIKLLEEENEKLKISPKKNLVSANINELPPNENENEKNTKVRNLIIGDSILRDINERGLKQTSVECLRGKNVLDIQARIRELEVDNFSSIILQGSTNDCCYSVDNELAEHVYTETIDEIKCRAPNAYIAISTICPRSDDKSNQERVDTLNSKLRSIAKDNDCILIDNDNNFKMRDDSVDSTMLLPDGLHLTKKGTKRLLTNYDKHVNIMKNNRNRNQSGDNGNNTSQGRKHHQPKHFGVRPRYTPNHNFKQSFSDWSVNEYHKPRTIMNPRGCYFCGERNHTKQHCRFGQPIQCFTCNRPGHKQQHCPDRNKHRNRP